MSRNVSEGLRKENTNCESMIPEYQTTIQTRSTMKEVKKRQVSIRVRLRI